MAYGFKIMVEGDYACFTRPELKVERVSYDVPTPGAMEGLVKSIYWKPAIKIVIDKIVVFNPINFINIRRNEKNEKVPMRAAIKQKNDHSGEICNFTISQRTAMILKNVRYGIEFHFELTGLKSNHEDESEEKHYNILLRRLKRGQCFKQPSLGLREFTVSKIELVDEFPLHEVASELKGDKDLGFMLYGMKFADGGVPKNKDWENPVFSDDADALFYRPHMIDGVIDIKQYREECIC